MDQNEYKKFTEFELLRMVDILRKLNADYADLMVRADTEEACEFFRTRANSALSSAVGFRQEWIRRMSDAEDEKHQEHPPRL